MGTVYWVELDLAKIRANIEAAEGKKIDHAALSLRLTAMGFVLASDGGYLAEAASLDALRPGELMRKRQV